MPEQLATFKSWYNGCWFGSVNVYNPWSVIQLMDDLVENPDWIPRAYWANTSSNSIVRRLIEVADEIFCLCHGSESIEKKHKGFIGIL
jgi:hypothetical protein